MIKKKSAKGVCSVISKGVNKSKVYSGSACTGRNNPPSQLMVGLAQLAPVGASTIMTAITFRQTANVLSLSLFVEQYHGIPANPTRPSRTNEFSTLARARDIRTIAFHVHAIYNHSRDSTFINFNFICTIVRSTNLCYIDN